MAPDALAVTFQPGIPSCRSRLSVRALLRLWPNGDVKIAGLRAGIIAAAPLVFAKYGIATPLLAAHVMAQISHECGAGHDVAAGTWIPGPNWP
jgi:hypothetical protein